ncbi:DUF3040 domain-containing protein [Geodermatophilus sp. SYSU D00758]
MTEREQQVLDDIERSLRSDFPELEHLLRGTGHPGPGRPPRWHRRALLAAVVAGLLLVVLGAALGSAPLALLAVCPPATAAVLVLWDRRRRPRTGRRQGTRRR